MFSSNSLPPADPYTPLPKSRMANTRPRATSVSFPPKPSTQQQVNSKRHTYHALQVPEVKGRDRVVSLPSAVAHQAVSTSRAPTPLPGNPRRLNNSDPRALLRALDSLLDPQSQRIPEHLDVDHLMAVHERDAMEREQRDAIKVHARMNRAAGQGGVCTGQTVFGSSLREATTYASTATVLGGYEHDVPIVVFRCVQELCRHGHHTPIPQRPPDRNRLLALISAFDSEPHFGLKTSFDCPSELPEAYALLTTYLLALPLPILDSDLFEALWAWCVLPSLRRTDFLEDDNNHNINRSRSSRQAPPDAACIRIAHLLLRLLPLSNLSLLVYMMGFFQRLPHMIREDVGRAVVAGRRASADPTDVRVINVAEGRSARAETMLKWLLERWDAIFNQLFMYGDVEQQKEYTSGVRRVDPELTPRVGQEGGVGGQPAILVRRPSDGLFDKPTGSESDASSVSSSLALGARLQDVTLEIAEEQNARLDSQRFPRYSVCHGPATASSSSASNPNDSGNHPPEEPPLSLPSPHAAPEQDHAEGGDMSYAQALHQIHLLERALERSDVAVGEAISETFKAREQVKELEAKLRAQDHSKSGIGVPQQPPVLELNLDRRVVEDWQAVVQMDTETLKRQLEETRKERDAALHLVEEIRRLTSA